MLSMFIHYHRNRPRNLAVNFLHIKKQLKVLILQSRRKATIFPTDSGILCLVSTISKDG